MAATTPTQGLIPQRLRRTLLLGLLGLLGIALLLLAMLPYLVSLDSIKGQLVAQLEAALQRQVEVGAVRLQLLSGLGVGLEDVTIYNPPGWQSPYVLKAGRLSVKVAWWPLLHRRLEVTTLRLHGGDLIIERDAQGRLNVADLAASTPASSQALSPPARHSMNEGPTEGETEARRQALTTLSVSEVVLQNMQITFVDRLIVPGQDTITALHNIQLHMHDMALGTPIPIDLSAAMSADGSPNLHLQGRIGPISEHMAVERLPIDLRLQLTDMHLDRFMPYLGLMLPGPTDLRGTVQLQAALTGTPHDFHAEAQVELHEVALRSGSFNGGARESGGVRLETDRANVRLAAQAVKAEPMRGQIDADVQRLQFDRRDPHTPTPAPGPPSGPTVNTPPSQPRRLPVTLGGQVRVAEGQLGNFDFQQMIADFHLANGILETTQQMTLYGGSYRGTMRVDLAPSEPSYTLDATVTGVKLGQVTNELTPGKHVLQGILDTNMQLVGQGMAWEVISQTLSGDGHVKITEAQLTSVDVLPKLAQLLREVGGPFGLTISKAWEPHAFRTIEGDWRLHQGKILTDHLRLRGEGVEALLKGYVGLDQAIEYAGNVFLPAQLMARPGAPTLLPQDESGRVVVPFTVQGTVAEPRVAISEKALVELVQGEIADTIRKRLGGKLEGLFGKPSSPDRQSQESDQTDQETGDRSPRQDLPGKLLRELLRR